MQDDQLSCLSLGAKSFTSSPCRYRKWSIAEDIDLVVRCELDGVMKYKGQDQLLLIKALNEYDAKSSGRFLIPVFLNARA